jgi:hypothetical protein
VYLLCEAVRQLLIQLMERIESDRESRNADVPATQSGAILARGQLMGPPQDLLHQDFAPPREFKYVIYDGLVSSKEAVYSAGRLVTDPGIGGSYNYVTPLPVSHLVTNPVGTVATWLGHFGADMAPPWLLSRLR